MRKRLGARGRPEPQQRIGNHGAQIVLARNRWKPGETRSGHGTAVVRRGMPGPPGQIRGLPTSLTDLTRLIDVVRAAGDADRADSLLRILGRHRETQEVAATLASFGRADRRADVDAILDGVSVRGAADCARIIDVLVQVGAHPAIESVLVREAHAPAERIAELFALLGERHRDHLFTVVVEAAVGKPERVIDIVGCLLLRRLSAAADRLVDGCRSRASSAEIATIADSLRDAGRRTPRSASIRPPSTY